MLVKKETNQKFEQLRQLILQRQQDGIVSIATNDFLDFLQAKNNLYYIQKLERDGFIQKIKPAIKNKTRGWSPAEYKVKVELVQNTPVQIHKKEEIKQDQVQQKDFEVESLLWNLSEMDEFSNLVEFIKNKDLEIENLKQKLEIEIQKQNERKSKISDILFGMLNL